ncbi:hypothetical protein [Flavisolibacter nicotianae]|uniref:hypothetical protein n=1 Tax=Flavisolibacter nicotianae TaxID=2364882 RepID=UPI000EABEE0F|nr:hypothetical protein [Flavisolibacter nicotianae]
MKTNSTRNFNSGFYPLKGGAKNPDPKKEGKQIASLAVAAARPQRPLLAELPVTWDEAWFANYE